ncbi:hypothetical protein JCM6882_006713 [Rhodosporidiobolus microsporus]
MTFPSSRYTTTTAFLESCSTTDILTYTVPTSSPIDESAPPPQLNQPDDHALESSTFFPPGMGTTGFVLSRVVEDGFALEVRWCAFSRGSTGGGHELQAMDQDGGSGDSPSPPPTNPFAELDAHPGTLPPVRFVFPARLVPFPSFTLSPDSTHLEAYAVTAAGNLYVLSFPLESLFYGADLAEGGEGGEWSDEFRLETVEGRTPVLVEGTEDGRVLVACEDGFVVCVDFADNDGSLIETELKSLSSFSIRSLVPSFSTRNLSSPQKTSALPSSSSPNQLISLASSSSPSSAADPDSPSSVLAFGLSRDRKLKIWNLQTGTAQPPIDLSKLVTTHSSSLALTTSSSLDSPQLSRTSPSALLSTTPRAFLRPILGSPSTSHASYLALFVPPSPTSSGAFVICGLEVDAFSGELSTVRPVAERVCPPSVTSGGSLVDFRVQRMDLGGDSKWTLWTVWDEGGEAEVRVIGVPELDAHSAGEAGDEVWITVERGTTAKTAQWTAQYFDEQLRDSPLSVAEVFLRHVSFPGRYPPATLEYALAEYEDLVRLDLESAGVDDEPEPFALEYPTALQRAAAVVGCTVALEQSPQTGAFLHDDFNKRLKLEWLRFVALLNESRTAALFPTHLAVDDERGVAAVFGRDSVSAPIVREAVHALASVSAAEIQQHQQLLVRHPEAATTNALVDLPPSAGLSADYTLRADVLPLLLSIRTLEARLSPAEATLLESTLLERLRTPFTTEIEDIALDLYERALEPILPEDALREVLASLAALDSPDRAVEALLRLLTAEQLSSLTDAAGQESATDLAIALLTDALATSISSRYALAKGLVTLLFTVWAAEDDDAVEADVMGASDSAAGAGEKLFARLDQTMAQALTALHGLAVLQWVAAEVTVPEPEALMALQEELVAAEGEGSDADGFVARFGELQVGQQKRQSQSDVDAHPVPTFGLLNALLRVPGYAPSLLPAARSALPVALGYGISSLSASLGLLPPSTAASSPAYEISSPPAATVLAFRLLQLGLPLKAGEFVELWPKTSGMQYVRGRAALELDEGEEARWALERAASGLYAVDLDVDDEDSSDSQSSSGLSLILPPSVGSSLARFYIHLVSLFITTPLDAAVARFAQLALEALEAEGGVQDEPTEKDLWIKLFRSYAALADYERAYEVIMAVPYHETQMTCLAHFISVVCENGATALLTQYSFAGLEADLERNLAFRARNSDPLARPSYYKVLYAYHISKGDYRSAGTVMYQQGRRIGELSARNGGASSRELATLQCQSYLAATNALSLVTKEHAWVAVVLGDEGERGNKRRKITYHIPEEEFDPAVASRPLEVLELADIRREYTIALARLQLADEFPELERTNFHLDPEAVVALFTQVGNFEQAFSSGRVLDVDLSSLFETVADCCVSLSLHPEGSQDATWVTGSSETATWEGSLASKAWRLLERQLERHDSAPAYRYRLVVLERVLATNRGGKVPAFLTDFLAKNDVHSLLKTLIKYDRLDEAFQFSLSTVQNSTAPPSNLSTTLPNSLFDQLLAIPPGDSPNLSDDVLKQRQQELREALKGRFDKVDKAQKQLLARA